MIALDGNQYSARHAMPAAASTSFQYLMLRLLIGALYVRRGTVLVKQGIDYSVFPAAPQVRGGHLAVGHSLAKFGRAGGASAYIAHTASLNRTIYRDLLAEYSNYFIQRASGSHVAAFVSVYRIIERISFTAPLISVLSSRDHVRYFDTLKSFFGGKDEGELKLLSRCIASGHFVDPAFLDLPVSVRFSSPSGYSSDHFDVAKAHLSDKFDSSDPSLAKFELKVRDCADACVVIRNRFFHFSSGGWQNNISLVSLKNPDEFFSCLNEALFPVIALLGLSLIEKDN